jgi:hypothetical protein
VVEFILGEIQIQIVTLRDIAKALAINVEHGHPYIPIARSSMNSAKKRAWR